MKALTVAQPWASLIVAGEKTIETRPSPPNGPMRPDGVRGLPGKAIQRAERIAIHAASEPPPGRRQLGAWLVYSYDETASGRHWMMSDRAGTEYLLPLGAIVGTALVADALPIVAHPTENFWTTGACIVPEDASTLTRMCGDDGDDLDDQLPLGDFTPGRWGWMLTEPEQCDPVPVRGRQGVWEWTP